MAQVQGGGLKGVMILAMLFVFGGAAYVSARDFLGDLCDRFNGNTNVIRRVGEVRSCTIAPGPSVDARQVVLRVRGGLGEGLVSVERKDGRVLRAYLTTRDHAEPELIFGADPLVPTSFIGTD
ncbi:MAG: hypothetical protein IT383_03280 [Deltaproteobacteria bacterium]|nr:hypothetical protein [Deltaproteobacteria bacterium]